MPKKLMMITAAGLALTSAQAFAQDYYLQGNLGLVFMGDSQNSGDMNENFVLGLGAGTLTDQAAYKFSTDFEPGGFASIALGKHTAYGPFRSELEFSWEGLGAALTRLKRIVMAVERLKDAASGVSPFRFRHPMEVIPL